MSKMDRINKITLENVVPAVFLGDEIDSQVWLVNREFDRGKAYCIDAASGTGKTSLCSFIYGVRRDYSGEIRFDGFNIRKLRVAGWCEIRRTHIAYLPQELDVFDELTALENVLLKNRLTGYKSEQEIRAMFERLEIDNRIGYKCGRMSVGQRQRVAFIRALCQPFDFILLDEPVSHLDERNNSICAEILSEEASARRAGVIFTSVGNPLALKGDIITLKL